MEVELQEVSSAEGFLAQPVLPPRKTDGVKDAFVILGG